MSDEIKESKKEYKYGFSDGDNYVSKIKKGLTRDTIIEISEIKKEPKWMKDFRLKAFEHFEKTPDQTWGPDVSIIDWDNITFYVRPVDKKAKTWEELPESIQNTFDKLGQQEAEEKYLDGIKTQYDSESVYGSLAKELTDKGVIFTDTDTALKEHTELFKQYFNTVIPYQDNRYAALNSAVWSGGTFMYIPKGVKLNKPLQSYFRINQEESGQFERTLIIVDEGAEVHYIEGCTAPTQAKDSLHAAVVEIVVNKNAKCRYTTIQNWSNNVINLVTKRAVVNEAGLMEWVDGNIGSKINMKYPACILKEPYARGLCVSIAVACGKNVVQDAGAKMIHLAPHTSSNIISKSIAFDHGAVNYRGIVSHNKNAKGSKSRIECDTLLLDDTCTSDTLPTNKITNNESWIEHEASVSKISEERLFYLMSRGLSEEDAMELIVQGFIEPFSKELPMEYAVELNQLIRHEMEGSLG